LRLRAAISSLAFAIELFGRIGMSRIRTSLVVAAMLATAPAALAQTSPREAMLVTADWLKAHAQDENLVVLHVGDRGDYDKGHIEGARFIGMESLGAPQANGLQLEMLSQEDLHKQLVALGITDKSRIVVYFTRGMIPSATRVIFTLEAAGLGDRTALLDGGLPEWQRLSYPLTATATEVKTGTLTPLRMKPRVVEAKTVQDHIKAPGYHIVDARASVFYDGVQTGGGGAEPHLKGHIVGAGSVPFTSVTGTDFKLKSASELAASFKAAGVQTGDKVIVYCHVGWQGTAVVFAARSLGFDAVLYDGSFQDWSKRNLPVETSVQ
jgi:thiosulfate/3-mercaptopyruvate sulfurtransferase